MSKGELQNRVPQESISTRSQKKIKRNQNRLCKERTPLQISPGNQQQLTQLNKQEPGEEVAKLPERESDSYAFVSLSESEMIKVIKTKTVPRCESRGRARVKGAGGEVEID